MQHWGTARRSCCFWNGVPLAVCSNFLGALCLDREGCTCMYWSLQEEPKSKNNIKNLTPLREDSSSHHDFKISVMWDKASSFGQHEKDAFSSFRKSLPANWMLGDGFLGAFVELRQGALNITHIHLHAHQGKSLGKPLHQTKSQWLWHRNEPPCADRADALTSTTSATGILLINNLFQAMHAFLFAWCRHKHSYYCVDIGEDVTETLPSLHGMIASGVQTWTK